MGKGLFEVAPIRWDLGGKTGPDLLGRNIVALIIVLADMYQLPKFDSPPNKYTKAHEVHHWDIRRKETAVVEDLLYIGNQAQTELTFYMETNHERFVNNGYAHGTCFMSGTAKREASSYVYSGRNCKLQIRIEPKKTTILDPDGQCQKSFCTWPGNFQSELVFEYQGKASKWELIR